MLPPRENVCKLLCVHLLKKLCTTEHIPSERGADGKNFFWPKQHCKKSETKIGDVRFKSANSSHPEERALNV